ncbi:high mobility group B protein 7-like isoform X1 [Populus alba x Populus x berolinensis]|nr:high mobility group B protein 7-like isoform X1 [Populus alba x Populus x berolinensis]
MTRKRGDAEPTDGYANTAAASLVRAKDGNGFVKCGECEEDVPVALISFHGSSLDGKVKMTSGREEKMVASAFGKDQSGGSATRLTVEDLKYLFMV